MSRDNGTTWEALTAGVRAGGTFVIKAAVRDEGGISGIRARETGDAAYQDMLASTNPKPGQWVVEKPAAVEGSAWIPGYKYFITTMGQGGDSALGNNWDQIDAEWTSSKKYNPGASFKYKPGAPSFSGTSWFAQKAEGAQGTISDPAASGYAVQYDGQYFEYIIKVTVDSTAAAYYPSGKTGNYSLELQVLDNNSNPAPYMTMVTYNVMIDNYYPTAQFTTQYNASTSGFYVSGTARDYDSNSGSIQGLERVLVYFQRGTNYMNAAGTVFSGNPAYARGKEGNTPAGSAPAGISNFPVLTLDNGVWKSPHAMVIDRQEFNGDIDMDGTYDEVFQDKGAVKEWAARFNTTKFSDGPLTVHYVIMDLAGNAAHYTQDIYIRNNPPVIREFNLGTDLDGDGIISPWELNAKSFIVAAVNNNNTPADESDDTVSIIPSMAKAIQTDFTVRNNQLRFDLNTFGGNGRKHYRVSYVTARAAPVNSTALTAGEVYTISTTNPGNTDWTSLGAPNNNSGTTFVAAGHASAYREDGTTLTTGAAIGYTGVWAKTGDFAADGQRPSGYSDRAETLFSGGGDFANIPDSIAGNTSALTHDRFFIIKVYDTTVSAGVENQQLAYAVLLNLDTDNVDETPPVAKVIPFYWNSLSDNSLYKNSRNNGHIELEADLPGTFNGTSGVMDKDPKVSGQISIRGTAYDNGRLDSLWVFMDGFDFSFAGAATTSAGSSSRQYVRAAVYSGGGTWNAVDRWQDKGWKFTVNTGAGSDHVHDQTGHSVSWRLDIDTARIAGVAAEDRVFRVLAKDGAPNNSAESNAQTAADQTPYYRMDVVPYVTEVETRLSAFNRSAPSVYARTAQGKYVAAENDPLTVYGFNFGASPEITLAGTVFKGPQLTLGTGSGSRSSWQSAKINSIGTSVKSGDLTLAVNGLSSLNNKNNNGAAINKQPNAVNNNTLTDDVEIDIWQFTEVFKARSETRYPAMKVGPQGQIGFSFANDYRWFNMPGYLYGTNTTDNGNFYSQSLYQNGWGGYSHNTFAFDPSGNTYGAAVNADESSVKQSANFSFFYRVPSATPSVMANQDNYQGTRLNSVRLENTTLPLNAGNANAAGQSYIVDINRIQNPQIVTSMADPKAAVSDANKVNVYMAYYDRTTKQIRFRAGSIGGNRTNTMGADFRARVSGQTFTARNDTDTAVISHNLTVNTPVYVRSTENTAQNKSIQYYVNSVPNPTTFTLKASLTGNAVIFTSNYSYTVSVVEGGFGDLTGYVANNNTSRVDYLDADPAHYQTVAADGEYLPGKTVTYTIPGPNTTRSTTYPQATARKPSPHLALGVVPGTTPGTPDVVVIAWYDSATGQLVFSYNTDPKNNGSKDNWQSNARTVDTNAGEYVSMAVDTDGGIHLAYYSSNGADLKYAYASSYSGNFTPVIVDAYQSVGTHTSITAGKRNIAAPAAAPDWRIAPAISYYASGGGSSLAAKAAYRDYSVVSSGGPAVAGVNEMDMYTGAWEVSTVPAKNSVLEYRISVGAYVDSSGKLQPIPSNPSGAAAVVSGYGYGSGDAASINGPTRVYGNGTLNPVVGYGTTTNLEMAQRK
jgi:hypothetical protein